MARRAIVSKASIDLRHIFSFLALFIILISLPACGKKEAVQAATPGGVSRRPPAPVVVASVAQRDIPVQITAIGNVESYQTVQIRSLLNGQIEKIFFKEGQDVHKGQVLFQLDKRPFQADLEKAMGTLRHDEAQAENSRLQAERYNQLEKQGVISREQADLIRSQAKADASAVYADKAAVDAARVQLQYTDITAPIDARTGAVMINLGNLVKANDTPFLVQLNQMTPIYVTFSIPEDQLSEVRRYSVAQVNVLASPKGQSSNPSEGRLTFIDNGVDTQTGTIKLKATFSNKDRRLWPGEFVDVTLNLSTRKNAILVPTKAIQTGQQGEYVYVVNPQNIAESRALKTVGTYQNYTVVAEGLNAGEQVVVNGQLRVAPNAKVAVQNAGSGSTPANVPSGGGQ
jgi:membrane fusion protein, multidrug efflux system